MGTSSSFARISPSSFEVIVWSLCRAVYRFCFDVFTSSSSVADSILRGRNLKVNSYSRPYVASIMSRITLRRIGFAGSRTWLVIIAL